MKKRSLSFSIIIVLLAVVVYFSYSNRQLIKDNYVVLTTDISPQSASLETKLKLTDSSRFLYQASQTELKEASSFKAACSGIEKQAIVLGCYSNQRVYIYDVTDSKLDGVRETTAAHELLHAAYERLSVDERVKVDQMLTEQSKKLTDKRVKETLSLYKELKKDELHNEMHSIFGTELRKLTPELETYYKKYFTRRLSIVDYSDRYQAVFTSLKKQGELLKSRLANDDKLKVSYESQLNNLLGLIQSDQKRLAVLKRSDLKAYNNSVGQFNRNVESYNQLLVLYKVLINDMNSLITKINNNVTQQNELTKKLDSNFSTIN